MKKEFDMSDLVENLTSELCMHCAAGRLSTRMRTAIRCADSSTMRRMCIGRG